MTEGGLPFFRHLVGLVKELEYRDLNIHLSEKALQTI